MQTLPRGRPLLIYGAVLTLLAVGVFLIPGFGPALLRTGGYAPHGYCILWDPGLLWLHVTNDSLIGASYVAIASSLAYLVYRGRRDLPFHWVLLAFGAFIISCGSTHFVEVWTFWQPMYWLSGYLKLITAVASVATAIALPPLIPRIIGLLDAARLSNERKQQLEAANAELAQLNLRLTELDELKSQMFANVSHELRTPLTLILGPVERLLDQATPEQRRDLEMIRRNGRLLQRHVDDLLDVARLEAGRLELRRTSVDLGQLARLTADYFVSTAEERGLDLQVVAPPELLIQADPDQIQRVIVNLVGNAIKFTPDGGAVRLGLRLTDEQALITVEDSGPGVPEAQRGLIFERFRQGEGAATRRFGGTGLGLAITRELVALHGGTVAVGASALGGACFTVALPIGWPEARPAPVPDQIVAALPALATPDASPAGDRGRPLVLVVEDNPEVRLFLFELLADRYRVATARDGAEGVAQALALRPDVIVSDVMMPGMSGDQLVLALRQHAELGQTPIFMLTARADVELRLSLLRGGAQDYLLKPFSPAELLARLDNLLAAQQARSALQEALANQEADLAILSAEVARRYQEAQAALRLRDEFIAIAGHELRTPVTALLANTQLLIRRAGRGDGLAERDLRAVQAIGTLGERLASMVEGLLDLARIEQGRLAIVSQPLDLTALVARICEAIGPALGERALVVRAPRGPLMVVGDAERLGQVLTNLLTNAAKYSPDGAPITVMIGREEGAATVAVRDEGIGIPQGALPQIFERFYQASNTDVSSTGGLGLGLYLVRQIVQLHGGQISVESVEGQGSTFTLTLPRLDDDAGSASAPPPAPGA